MAPILPRCPALSDDGASSGSASAIVTDAASGFHVLRIDGYSRTKSTVPNGQCVESRPFRVAGHTWAIEYYPNGSHLECAGYLSLFLFLKEPVAGGVVAQWEFSFIDQVELQKPSHLCKLPESTFDSVSSPWGYEKFVKKRLLERSDRLRNDCFTLRCDIVVAGKPHAEDAKLPSSFVVVPPPDWQQHFRSLLMGGQGADVAFRVGGEEFMAHRCVLAARSPVFSAGLFGSMREGTVREDCIKIDDMLPLVFKSLLHFIYTDSLPDEMEGQEDATAAPTMAQHLLEAADRYDMKRLKLICEERLCRYIDVNTVATTLALAEQHHCLGLKEACFDFLKSHKALDAAKETDGFQHLLTSCPSVFFELMSKLAAR
ncbi:hypothetical protein PR202_gb08052 [Eleusine coracana subsp. coracana]|uniref:Uncharacterized protein n=1 Tax=Eleusine coracana subsp. coracana TaxID=191504 RepID=A0AAV5EDQ4_ELECO|nr:hypothetical protein QOZ80_2BG0180450 [Eleusine coracana subsp. coracana]GJN20652.1 hypothetical protein PR202_gb08052 [Eleusine coracana subsp. coracana]